MRRRCVCLVPILSFLSGILDTLAVVRQLLTVRVVAAVVVVVLVVGLGVGPERRLLKPGLVVGKESQEVHEADVVEVVVQEGRSVGGDEKGKVAGREHSDNAVKRTNSPGVVRE